LPAFREDRQALRDCRESFAKRLSRQLLCDERGDLREALCTVPATAGRLQLAAVEALGGQRRRTPGMACERRRDNVLRFGSRQSALSPLCLDATAVRKIRVSSLPDLEQYREYLGLLGRLQLDDRLAGKVHVSGVVQATMLEACRQAATWESLDEEARAGWLRRIFANNLLDEIRRFRAAARDVARANEAEGMEVSRESKSLAAPQFSRISTAPCARRTTRGVRRSGTAESPGAPRRLPLARPARKTSLRFRP
jgi:hypothetical protein